MATQTEAKTWCEACYAWVTITPCVACSTRRWVKDQADATRDEQEARDALKPIVAPATKATASDTRPAHLRHIPKSMFVKPPMAKDHREEERLRKLNDNIPTIDCQLARCTNCGDAIEKFTGGSRHRKDVDGRMVKFSLTNCSGCGTRLRVRFV